MIPFNDHVPTKRSDRQLVWKTQKCTELAENRLNEQAIENRTILWCTTAVLVGATLWASVASAQSLDGAGASTADIARDAALAGEQTAVNLINTEARKRAAALMNNIRTKLDACGDNGMLAVQAEPAATKATTTVPSRPSLNWNPLLDLAASDHAIAMARQQFFDHTDPQGRTVGQRVKAVGYRWRVVGENLAAGQDSVDEAVRGWLLSTSHCNILLDARFSEFGLARVNAQNPLDPYRTYWALVVAQPKQARAKATARAVAR